MKLASIPEKSKPDSWPQPWLWQPSLIVFISSGCTMILELVAGRIIAPYVGVSLYTWTSVIGVVLAGISLGNYLGGRLADRWASPRLLGSAFILGGLSSFGILAVDRLGGRLPGGWPIVIQILALTAALFLVPSVVLGTISPILVKLAVRDLAKTGSTVGKIYAAGSVGSIVGTFATGFLLISWLGTHTIVWGVAVILLALGMLFLLGSRWKPLLLAALILASGSFVASRRDWLHGSCNRETNYFCIKVKEQEQGGELVRVLILDRMVHSHSSLSDPTKLVYDYEQMYGEITAYRAEQDNRLRALFIGGGGYTFPRYMEAVYPNSDLQVIEIDPGVTETAYEQLGVRRDTQIVTYNEDARLFLARKPAGPFDLIFGDAFNDFSVPYHLTTKEFNDRVRVWLADDGLYVINMIDGPAADFLRAFIHTLRQTFRYVYVAPTNSDWHDVSRTTFVLIAADVPLDMARLRKMDADAGGLLLVRHMLSEEEVNALLVEKRVAMLSDRYAPVDQMLAPVFRDEVPK